ncbi:MAG: GNAT family N-acetyltransferase [Nanoarchaeota archaeon]
MLKFKTVTDEKGCRELWEYFSPKQILWDLWDFRFCFHADNFRFNFIVGLDGKNETGLLPLVFESKGKYYTYFGEEFPEQNRFLLKDKKNIGLFLEQCPMGTSIPYISSEEAKYYELKPDEKRYSLGLAKYGNSFENYLKSFTKKHRKNLNYDLKKLKDAGYASEHNSLKDFERLVELNKLKFGAESNYSSESFVSGMSKLIDSALRMGALDIISIKIGSKVEAVGLGVFYNKVYYVLSSGRNVEIKNLGKLLIVEEIKSAIANKCSEVDFLSTEANWKELWNLDSEQMYKFEK